MVLINTNSIPTSNYKELKNYIIQNPDLVEREVKADYPIAIRPSKNSGRILAQRGVFTIHGKQPICLFKLIQQLNVNNYPVIDKIVIDGKSKKNLLKELYMNGISHSVIFPELVGIANELKNRYSIDFLGKDNWNLPFQ